MKALIALLALTVACMAADVGGKWTGTFDRGPHLDSAYLELTQDGEKITGYSGPNEERKFEIRNGRIEGTKLSFEVQIPDGPLIRFSGSVDGDSMRLWASSDLESLKGELKLKRAN